MLRAPKGVAFSMSEDVNKPGGAAHSEAGSAPNAPLASGSAAALREGLDQLARRNLPHEVFASESLQLMVRTFGLKTAALIGCDAKRTRVWILADVGLSSKARDLLIGPAGRWIVLRPVNDHRINVINSALDNPFVPPGLVSVLGMKSMAIATVPFYNGNVPVGAVVLFSQTPATFSNQVLGTLSQTLRQCARVLGEASDSHAEEHGPVGKAQGTRMLETLQIQPQTSLKAPATAGRAPAVAEPAPAQATAPAGPSPADRAVVARLETELAKSRAQLEHYAGQQAEMQKLHRKILDAQATAAQARGQTTVLRTALAESHAAARPAAGAGNTEEDVRLSGTTFDFALRLTDSINGLLNRTLGFDSGQSRILKNVQQEWQQLRASIVSIAAAEPLAERPAPSPPPAAPEPERAPGTIDMGRASDVLRQTTLYLHNAFVELDRQTFILANLRDALYSWRINRSDEDDSSDADIEASGSLWELGDQMDDLVETMDNYRLHLFALSRELEQRMEQPKAPQ